MTMRIDVWADLVCPWCFIGKRRLQRALAMTDVDATVVHRAFQLDPAASTHSEPTLDHLSAKYGITKEQALEMMSDVTEVAAGEGLNYHLDKTMTGNTRDAHRLLLWSQSVAPETTQGLMESLYSAYFEHGKSIFSIADLTPFAQAIDLDPDAVREILEGRDFLSEVAEDQANARDLGANGVPFFVFNNAVGLSGAQPIEAFAAAIEQAGAL